VNFFCVGALQHW